MSSPLILDFACPSDEEFEESLDGFSEDAKKGYRRERARVLRERREAAIAQERAVQHGAPVTQGAPPKPQPKPAAKDSAFYKTIGQHLGQRFAEEAGKIRAEMRKALDDLVRERSDGLDDIHADYRQLKADIDHAVHSKIADALRLEREKRMQLEIRVERALDQCEKLRQQLDGARIYDVGRTE